MDADSILHDLGFANIGDKPINTELPPIDAEYEYKFCHGKTPEVIVKSMQDDDGRR